MKIAIASMNFSPGHLSHIFAYAQLFEQLGHNVILLLDKGYSPLIINSYNRFDCYWFEDIERISKTDCDVLLLMNPSIHNHRIAMFLKKRFATRIIYLYHEPWDSVKGYLREGVFQAIKAVAAHYFSVKVLKLADSVIVPSHYAAKLYEQNDKRYNTNYQVVPLLFDDEAGENIEMSQKEYFSYIGHAVRGHAFDLFVDFIKFAQRELPQIRFEIATRTDLSEIFKNDKQIIEMINRGTLRVIHGRPLTNEEINIVYRRSFCVWNIYRRSTQSGVLPKAFMFGTPVIASNIGSFPEYVKEGCNGFLVDSYDRKVLLEKLNQCLKNITILGHGARETFKTTFWWRTHLGKISNILNTL